MGEHIWLIWNSSWWIKGISADFFLKRDLYFYSKITVTIFEYFYLATTKTNSITLKQVCFIGAIGLLSVEIYLNDFFLYYFQDLFKNTTSEKDCTIIWKGDILKLTLILPTLKMISLCHQYRARPEVKQKWRNKIGMVHIRKLTSSLIYYSPLFLLWYIYVNCLYLRQINLLHKGLVQNNDRIYLYEE